MNRRGDGRAQMLRVIEHEQCAPIPERCGNCRNEIHIRGIANAERLRDPREHERRIAKRREFDERHAARKVTGGTRQLRREPRLSDAARSRQGHHPECGEPQQHVGDRIRPSDEARRENRHIRGRPLRRRHICRPPPLARNGGALRCRFERAPLVMIGTEGTQKQLQRLPVRRFPHPALEGADSVGADPGLFRQSLLRESFAMRISRSKTPNDKTLLDSIRVRTEKYE